MAVAIPCPAVYNIRPWSRHTHDEGNTVAFWLGMIAHLSRRIVEARCDRSRIENAGQALRRLRNVGLPLGCAPVSSPDIGTIVCPQLLSRVSFVAIAAILICRELGNCAPPVSPCDC
jgi:hypothetical protein